MEIPALLPDWRQILVDDTWDNMVFHVFLVLAGAGLLDLIARRILRRIRVHVTSKTQNPWDDTLMDALPAPLAVGIWVIALRTATLLVGGPIFSDPRAGKFVSLILIADVVWFFSRWIVRIEDAFVGLSKAKRKPEERIDETTVHAVGKLLRLAILLTGVLVALETWDIDVSAVLAAGGIGGIAIGFAARDILANFFGGLTVYLDQPFKVGDWIRSPDREIEGTVEYIGWRHTRIRTFDKRPLYVPNAIFTTIVIENPQRMLNRRIYETIGVRYDDIARMDGITRDVREMLLKHPDIDTTQLMMVYFNEFGASSCNFFVYTFTKTTVWSEYHAVKHDVLLKIANIIASHGGEIAFPTSTLHVATFPQAPES